MGKKWGLFRVFCSSVLLAFLFISQQGFSVKAAGTSTYTVTGTYDQTSARAMLDTINSYRHSGNAWQYEENGSVKDLGRLENLTYDYDLEKIAMQRAMEMSVRYDGHDRPDGSSCFTCTYNGISSSGENLCAATCPLTTQQAYEMWLEKDCDYKGQGHRRNMLFDRFTRVGIAHLERGGSHFWVQEFGLGTNGSSSSPAVDGQSSANITVKNEFLKSSLTTKDGWEILSITYGDAVDASEVVENLSAACLRTEPPITSVPAGGLSVSDTNVANISGDKIVANNVGQTTINAVSQNGQTISMQLRVKAVSLSNTEITFDKDTYYYDGKAVKPVITVKINDHVLVEGVDYTVSFTGNKGVGYGTAHIVGKGNCSGSTFRSFLILDKSKNKQVMADAYTYKNVTYSVKGANATITGTSKNISSFTAPATVTFKGKKYNVTAIGKNAFKGLTTLKKIDLSKAGIKTIGQGAFDGCTKLNNIKINAGKTKNIKSNAFRNVPKKAKVNVVSKDKNAYKKCMKALKKVGLKSATFKMKKK